MKKKFLVPATWEVHGWIEVEAEDWDDAVEAANHVDLDPYPTYVQGSFRVLHEDVEDMRENGLDGVPVGETNRVFVLSGRYPNGDELKNVKACTHHAVPRGYRDSDIWRYEVTEEQLQRSETFREPIPEWDDFVVTSYWVFV